MIYDNPANPAVLGSGWLLGLPHRPVRETVLLKLLDRFLEKIRGSGKRTHFQLRHNDWSGFIEPGGGKS